MNQVNHVAQSDPAQAGSSLQKSLQRMLLASGPEAGRLKRSLAQSALASLAEGLALVCLFPMIAAVLQQDITTAWRWLAIMAALMLTDGLLRWAACGFSYSPSYAKVSHHLRLMLGNKLRRISQQQLADKRTGDMCSVLSSNVDEVVAPMTVLSGLVIRTMLVPVVVALALLFVDWRLALFMVVLFPLALPIYWRQRQGKARGMQHLAAANARATALTLEYVQGLSVLKAVDQAGDKAQKLQDCFKQLESMQGDGQKKGSKRNLQLAALAELGTVAMVLLAALLTLNSGQSLALLAALAVVVVRFAEALGILGGLTAVLDYMEAGLKRLDALMQLPELETSQVTCHSAPESFSQVAVHFDKVSFAYADNEPQVLDQLELCFAPQTLTALVGPSGGGKSTVIRLLMRYADPLLGRILFNGRDIRDIPETERMALISVVFQDVYLFDDSLMNNIRMGNPKATDAEVIAAAGAANCLEFINRLPEGFNSEVGEGGCQLSGGERQRVSIARAILKDAPVVVLDEPTAALDTESELAVQQAVDNLVRDKTVILIAHRLSTIVSADQILVLDQGKVQEAGRHHELLARQGRYWRMWQAQQQVKSWHIHNKEQA